MAKLDRWDDRELLNEVPTVVKKMYDVIQALEERMALIEKKLATTATILDEKPQEEE